MNQYQQHVIESTVHTINMKLRPACMRLSDIDKDRIEKFLEDLLTPIFRKRDQELKQ